MPVTAEKGQISVHTENLFPIIKKWLYSEHDIFLRELAANATDAISKRANIGRTQNQEIPTGDIVLSVNRGKKTITFSDNGIGFAPTKVVRGSGLTNIEERCKMIGAVLTLKSQVDIGTQIQISLNLSNDGNE